MALWQMPDGIRVEHALQSGSEIPPFYDSMIAKIISHGADRNEARGRLICGLEQTAAFGVTTNQGFLISCLRHPGFAAGEATTAFIGKHRDELLAPRANDKAEAALAALLLYVTNPHAPPWRSGRSLAATFPLTMRIDLGHGVHEVEIVRERDGGYVASRRWRRASLRDRRTRPRYDPLPHRRHDGIGKIPARRRPALCPASRRHDCRPRPDARRAGVGRGGRRRRQGARGDERPRRRGAGQAGRAGRCRPAGDDAGGDEDGACAHGGCRRHGVGDRCRRRRAGDDGEDRRGDRGGAELRRRRPSEARAGTHNHMLCCATLELQSMRLASVVMGPCVRSGRRSDVTPAAPSPHSASTPPDVLRRPPPAPAAPPCSGPSHSGSGCGRRSPTAD